MGKQTNKEKSTKEVVDAKSKADALMDELTSEGDTETVSESNESKNMEVDDTESEESIPNSVEPAFKVFDHMVKYKGKFYEAGTKIYLE